MLNLHAEDVLYIKYVDNFFPERRDFCGADPQPKFRQSPRQVIQQSGPIAPFTSITVRVFDALLSINTRGETVKTFVRLGKPFIFLSSIPARISPAIYFSTIFRTRSNLADWSGAAASRS